MFPLECLDLLISWLLENILSKGLFIFPRIIIYLLSVPLLLFFFPHISCCVLLPRDFDMKNHSTFPSWMLSCLSFLASAECFPNPQLRWWILLQTFPMGQPTHKLTPPLSLVHGVKPFSCFGTRLNCHSWLFLCTSSKCCKTPANLVSQLLAVFAAVQKVFWLSTRPVVVLADRCSAASRRGHPTWGPCRSLPRLDETVGNTSYNCIKIWTWREKCFYSHHGKNQEHKPEENAGRAENRFHPEAQEVWATTGAFLQLLAKDS